MRIEEAGPRGPASDTEPFELETPDAAPRHHNSGRDCVQASLDALCRQDSGLLPAAGQDDLVYDSGWDDSSGVNVRVMFRAGEASPQLRDWVRELALSPEAPVDGERKENS